MLRLLFGYTVDYPGQRPCITPGQRKTLCVMAERIMKRPGGDQRGALRERAYASRVVVAMCTGVTATRARHREAHSRHAPHGRKRTFGIS